MEVQVTARHERALADAVMRITSFADERLLVVATASPDALRPGAFQVAPMLLGISWLVLLDQSV